MLEDGCVQPSCFETPRCARLLSMRIESDSLLKQPGDVLLAQSVAIAHGAVL